MDVTECPEAGAEAVLAQVNLFLVSVLSLKKSKNLANAQKTAQSQTAFETGQDFQFFTSNLSSVRR